MNKLQAAEQLRRTLQIFAASLPQEQILEIPAVFDPWQPGKNYKGGDYFTHGVNGVGDPQLYQVNDGKNHTSQADWIPGTTGGASLYTAVGLDDAGYPMWAQPTGAHDAYDDGNVVNYNGTLYESQINGNTTVPGSDERWWTVYKA